MTPLTKGQFRPHTTPMVLDAAWAAEAEDRLGAYQRGEVKAMGLSEIIAKYKAQPNANEHSAAGACTVFPTA